MATREGKKPGAEERALEPATEALPRVEPAPTTPPPTPGVSGVVGKGWENFRRTLKEAAQWGELRRTPYGLLPALLLAIEGIARGFDSSIFGVVLPVIIRDLDVSVQGILTALNLFGILTIFAVVGLSYLLDRVKRVPWVVGGSLASGFFSLVTPQMRSVVPLGASRIGDSIGSEAATIPRFSLLNDYYPLDARGKVFAMIGTLQRFGTLAAPLLIGLLVVRTGDNWRLPFLITGPIMLAVGVLMLMLLKEPIRGYMERKALGETEEVARTAEPPPSFGTAWRTIWGIRTLRRLFVGSVVGVLGERVYLFIFPLLLFEAYRLDSLGIGRFLTVAGAAGIAGGFLGGGIVDSLIRRRPQRVLIFSGVVSLFASFALFGIASTPPLWVLYVIFGIFGFASALLGPARGVFYGLILPAHVRTLGGGVFALAAIPAIIFFQVFVARIDEWGLGGVLSGAAVFFIISAIIDISAAGFFERDMRSATASQLATQEYKRTKAAGATKMLVCRDVDVDYDGVQVLFGVDFDVEEGEIIALLGTNGAGKSTLLRAISGVREAAGGAVVFDGREITHVPPYEIAGRGVVHMPGGKGVFPGLTVRENLMLGGWLSSKGSDDIAAPEEPEDETEIVSPGIPRAEVTKSDVEEVLEIFPALQERLDARAGTLSGGEQQMVALAQAFLQRPRLLMIDELSLGLAPTVVQELLESVRRIHERGVTLIIVEQSVNVALTIAERAIFMEKGEVKFFGQTKELLRRPDILRAVYVKGTAALTEGPVSGVRSEKDRRRQLLEEARPILGVHNLTKSFGGVHAVRDVSFELREGEILGLIGPNGAGKTTIFDLISGYVPLDRGSVVYDGVDVTRMGADQRARLQLVRRFQDARLFPSLTVYEAILVALERRNEVKNTFLTALQLPQVRQSERRVRRRADTLIELLELGAFRDKFVKELSTGLRRITDLACVLAAEPKVLLLDEPSSGIAQAEAESLAPLLRRVRFETGCSILIIEHDMPLISSISDELLALDQGSVVTRGTPQEVLNDPQVVESYLGTSEKAIRRSGVIE